MRRGIRPSAASRLRCAGLAPRPRPGSLPGSFHSGGPRAGEQLRRAVAFLQQKAILFVRNNFQSALPQLNDADSPYTVDERSWPNNNHRLVSSPIRIGVPTLSG
ncbi:MAG: hypothetical protein AW08_03890 [Candidatus Accumulibacter adjunctus]|uniref:Uncharacterized protein n=1 Tax=Candidatus Accumulibacter adjunctus TaxID=1454001 RepID=A0A011PBW6_9PROT|nr:MAG: hypothetical protein AW08_03890 [Candidatus Accumulibacter adjunctus]